MSLKRKKKYTPGRKYTVVTYGHCPDPCGKLRYASRTDARKNSSTVSGRVGGRYRAYKGEEEVCESFWHLTSWAPMRTVEYYRNQRERLGSGGSSPAQ